MTQFRCLSEAIACRDKFHSSLSPPLERCTYCSRHMHPSRVPFATLCCTSHLLLRQLHAADNTRMHSATQALPVQPHSAPQCRQNCADLCCAKSPPAATIFNPSAMNAALRMVAVVVPSPAVSFVRAAAWRTSFAPMFSTGSSSSTSLAIVTPSFTILGLPYLLSSTTLRPCGERQHERVRLRV